MGKTVLNIKANYDKLSKSEKQIADFLIETPNNILPLYITELSDLCGVSEATVVRFAKKIGFDPAVMASPFITTIVDALALLVYFGVASAILNI